MQILIITSKDHIYANFFLKKAFENKLFKEDSIFIWEQDTLIPGKTKLAGFLKYLKTSGIYYVFEQISKHYLFLIKQIFDLLTSNYNSSFYPYWKISSYKGTRQTLNGVKTENTYNKVKNINPDLIISIFSKEIIPKRIFEIPKLGTVNIHPAFLPSYRGVSPVFWSMSNNEKSTGVTLHYITKQIDIGDIIARKKINIEKNDTEHRLYLRTTEEAYVLFNEYFIRIRDKKNNMENIIQTQEIQSYYSLPTRKAVKKFLKNRYKFFTIKEMIK